MTNCKKDILIIMGRYLPGYKGGGPTRSIANLVENLGNEYNFKILAYDRDYGDTEAYSDIIKDRWNKVGNAEVFYIKPKGFTFKVLKQMVKDIDIVYLCGCFNDYAIKILIMKKINMIKQPVIIAAMGLFSPMAFRIKYIKKKSFINIFNVLGMFKNIYWSATSEMEKKEIEELISTNNNVFIAQDLPRKVSGKDVIKIKNDNKLNIIFLSRISKKKNLKYAIQILQHVKSSVKFNIYGPVEDKLYWEDCKIELDRLPRNIEWEYGGAIEPNKILKVFKKGHIFLFPTLGENYGHVIQEALSAGCSCIISDQTPWQDLDKYNIGRVIPLENKDKFINEIEYYSRLTEDELQEIAIRCVDYAKDKSNSKDLVDAYKEIFNYFIIN